MVRVALAAAESSKANIEVIDLLTLWPWDRKTVAESVARTGRLVTLEEAPEGSGWGGDVVSHIAVECVRRAQGAAASHHASRCAGALQRNA